MKAADLEPSDVTDALTRRLTVQSDEKLITVTFKNPPHPGSFLRGEIIQGRGLTVSTAAEALGVIRPTLSAVLNGRASLSPEMALRIEKAFGLSMDTLMRMQLAHDIAQTRARADEIDVAPYVPKVKLGAQASLL